MPYQAGRRIKLMNLVADVLKKKLYFGDVSFQLPTSPPSLQGGGVKAHIALGPETIAGITDREVDSEFRLSVILFVRTNKDIDLFKCEAIDKAHESIMSLQTDAAFQAVATMIEVDTIDPGPLSLSVYGLDFSVEPPSGVVRFDVRVSLTYQALPD